MTYQETLDYLFSQLPMYQNMGKIAYKADLSNTLALCRKLGNPEKKLRFVHVAGTNGKGSTSHILASILQEADYQVGLYTSPHLKDFRERVKVNGCPISQEEVIQFVQQHKADFENIQLSFFEWTIGLALMHFLHQGVDIVVLETGLGGRLDATNVVLPEVSVITNIGLDHTLFLGETLPLIAGEKAGIIKSNIPVVVGEKHHETKSVFESKAFEMKTQITFAEDVEHKHDTKSDLKGNYQNINIQTALATINELNKKHWKISNKAIRKGLTNVITNTGLLGRWQQLNDSPLTIADTAHNKEGLSYTMEQIQEVNKGKLHLVLGFVEDKHVEELLSILPDQASYYIAPPSISRAMSIEKLKTLFKMKGESTYFYKTVKEALNKAQNSANQTDTIYIGGSTFVVAEIL